MPESRKSRQKPVAKRAYTENNQNLFSSLSQTLDAGEVRVGAVAARQVLLVEGRVLADQVAVGLVDVGERPQLAGLPLQKQTG